MKLVFLNVVVSPLSDFDGFFLWERIGTNYSMNMDEHRMLYNDVILYQHVPQKSAGHVGSCAIHVAYMGLFVIGWSTPSPAIFYITFLTHNVGSLW